MKNPFEIILKILDIIEYSDDKNEFAENFMYVCNMKAIVEMLQLLPEKENEEIHNLLKETKDENLVIEKLKEYIHPDEFHEILSSTSALLFQEYIEHILPTLNTFQKENLADYLKTIAA